MKIQQGKERKFFKAQGAKKIDKPKPVKEGNIKPRPNPVAQLKKPWEEGDFEKKEEIGKGRYGTVFKAIEKKSGKIVALKEVTAETITQSDCFDLIKNEIEIHTRLRHPNIAKMYGYIPSPDKLSMLLEYVDGGDLFEKLVKAGGIISEPEAANVLNQLLDALIYLRDKHVIHRDIKPQNILICKGSKPGLEKIKLCDFTWAAHSINERRITVCGTFGYCAPEVTSAIDYDIKVDIWSAGVLLYQMLTGTLLVEGDNLKSVQQTMMNLKVDFPEHSHVSEEAKKLLYKLLAKVPEDRPSLEKIKIDSWLMWNLSKYKTGLSEQKEKVK